MRGRKPKPRHLKLISGSRQPIADNPQPQPMDDQKPPSWIGKYGVEFWQVRAPELIELGILTEADIPSWTLLCLHWQLLRQAHETLEREGSTSVDERGLQRKHPAWTLFNNAAKQFHSLSLEFGLTPLSRQRLDVRVPAEPEENPFLELLQD